MLNIASIVTDLSPLSIFELQGKFWFAVLITTIFSWSCFLFSWLLGYVLALVAGLASQQRWTYFISVLLKNVMDFFYIVPIVLVISLVYGQVVLRTVGYIGNMDSRWPSYLAAIIPVLIGVFILSGYQVFDSAFKAIVTPDDRAQEVVDALYVPIPRRVPKGIWLRFATLSRRIDFEIHSYNLSVKRALHLSFVAVVIVEMVIAGIYKNVFQSASIFRAALENEGLIYGVGGEVVRLQGSANLPQIAGMIWLIFIMDYVAQFVLRVRIKRKFDRHYRDRR